MAKRKYTAEEIVTELRQVEVSMANGKATPQACRESGITEQTYFPRTHHRRAFSQQAGCYDIERPSGTASSSRT
jgi:hypothetical protein